MKRLLVILLLMLPVVSFGKLQGQALIDSTLQQLPKIKDDTNKVKILIGVAQRCITVDADKGIPCAQQALVLSDKLGWSAGKAEAYFTLAWCYRSKSEYTAALAYCDTALRIFQEINKKKEIALVYQIMSIIHIDQSNYPQALDLGLKSLKISEEIQDERLIGGNLTNIGIIYDDQGNLAKAIEYHTNALKVFRELKQPYPIANSLSNIGYVYNEQKDYSNALKTFLEALEINMANGMKYEMPTVLGYIGNAYCGLKDYSKALENLHEAENIVEETGDKAGVADKMQGIGLTYLTIAQDSVSNIRQDKWISNIKQIDLDSAIKYFTNAATIHNDIGNLKDLSENYRDLSTAWELSGNAVKALQYHKLYMVSKDSVFSQQNKEKIANLETKRELDLKDKQLLIDKLDMEKKRVQSIFYIAGIVFLVFVVLFIYRNYNSQVRSNALLAAEKKISEDLLLNILPAEVAKELKDKGSAEAKSFDNVTVLFTDFVGFTSAGENMTHQELVNELDTCFKTFDNIIGKYQIEKIKTIGDAYLAVSGLPAPQVYHAENIVQAALEIRAFAEDRKAKLGDKTFHIRIGIHSGNVIAGIVGSKKFAYDIWGDTVNVAARMEQSSEPGKINISETSYDLIKYKFNCTYRGEIEAKNKGKLGMYFVDGAKG
jgi:adenylate cyclase